MALEYALNPGNTSYSVIYNSCTAGDVVIPDTHNGLPITAIGAGAFTECGDITSVVISNNVTAIDDDAFSYCNNLNSVILSTNLITIGNNSFSACTSLTSISLPSNLISIGNFAFASSNLTGISIPDSVETIGQNIILGCQNLNAINVGFNNFYYSSLDGVLFSKNFEELLSYPPAKGNNYSIPDSTKSILPSAFDSTNISNLTAKNIEYIGDYAFYGCSNLNDINLGPNIKYIESYAFFQCVNLQNIYFPNLTNILGQSFQGCTSLINATFGNKIIQISNAAFTLCSSLENVYFTGNIPQYLGENIFEFTNPNLKIYRYSTKSGWSNTFQGTPVFLIDSPIHQGLQTFGFPNVSSGKISIKKQNIRNGKMTLFKKFMPNDLQNLSLWLKADAGVTLDGTNVTAWADQSGSGRNASADTGFIPNYVTIGGKSFVNFPPSARMVFAPIWEGVAYAGTIALVARFSISAGVAYFFRNENSVGEMNLRREYTGGGNPVMLTANSDGTLFVGQGINNNTNYIIETVFDNGNIFGSVEISVNDISNSFPGVFQSPLGGYNSYIGGGTDPSNIAEMIVYNRVLTTTERQQVVEYLNDKYNIY